MFSFGDFHQLEERVQIPPPTGNQVTLLQVCPFYPRIAQSVDLKPGFECNACPLCGPGQCCETVKSHVKRIELSSALSLIAVSSQNRVGKQLNCTHKRMNSERQSMCT